MRTTLLLVALAFAAAVGGAIFVESGAYDVSATEQHYRPTYWLTERGMRRSVEAHAREIKAPPLDDAALIDRGFVIYRAHCVQCHGAPGVAPEPFALGLTPAPANLAHAARSWNAAQLFWIVKNGIKMTGMPAWDFRLSERDLWAVTAYTRQLAQITPQQYAEKARASGNTSPPFTTDEITGASGDAAAGRRALLQYGCGTCHLIPGVVGADVQVGPPLERIGTRQVLAGRLANTPENMLRWLRHPKEVDDKTAMPDLGVSDRHARDMAAYLRTLR